MHFKHATLFHIINFNFGVWSVEMILTETLTAVYFIKFYFVSCKTIVGVEGPFGVTIN